MKAHYLLALVFYTAVLGHSVILESLAAAGVPKGWTKLRDADTDQQIKLKIALRQPNTELFEQALYDMSTPQHPMYGQHLSRMELRDLLKPRKESTDTVLSWLNSAGIPNTDVEDDSDWINFKATVGQANRMLNTTLAVYSNGNTEKIRAVEYSVPQEIARHITMIAPIIRFAQIREMRSNSFDEGPALATLWAAKVPTLELDVAKCNNSMTPECLRALYKVGDYKADPSNNSLLGVCGYLEEYARYDQLAKFQKTYAPYTKDATFSVVQINGGGNNQTDIRESGEANLDIQYAIAMSYKTPVVYYSAGGRGPLVPDIDQPDPNDVSNEPYLEFLGYMLKLPAEKLPQTLTTSYGENEQSVPRAYNEKVCQMFGQLGARGVSVIFSSGDSGPGRGCQTNDGKKTTRFMPIFPGACPYVTSVGATHRVDPEVAADFSSGGFSDIYPRPPWQNRSVSAYLDLLGDQWAGLYNPRGRGFPDVAAQGVNYHVFDKGSDHYFSGTSASSPTFAGLVSLLNNARLAAGKKPMGFLNPWLYSEGLGGFTDIIHGGSTGCWSEEIHSRRRSPWVPYASWNATKGWDPVTGLGTPIFDKLLQLSNPGCPFTKIEA